MQEPPGDIRHLSSTQWTTLAGAPFEESSESTRSACPVEISRSPDTVAAWVGVHYIAGQSVGVMSRELRWRTGVPRAPSKKRYG